jgi:hypothetical protein
MDSPDRWEHVGRYLQSVAESTLFRSTDRQEFTRGLPPTWEELVRHYFKEEAAYRGETDRVVRTFVAREHEVPISLPPVVRYHLLIRIQCAHDFLGMVFPPLSDLSPFGPPSGHFSNAEVIEWLLLDLWQRRFDHWLKLTAISLRGPFAFYGIDSATDWPPGESAANPADDSVDQLMDLLKTQWGRKTLAQLRDEAVLEENGTLFESIRIDNGPRLMLLICVTNAEQIEIIERAFALSDSKPPSDWETSTMQEMAVTTMKTDGLSYQDLRDAYGKRTAVSLCATHPDAMKILQTLFELPA